MPYDLFTHGSSPGVTAVSFRSVQSHALSYFVKIRLLRPHLPISGDQPLLLWLYRRETFMQ
jgi:hypothetical protein